MYSITFVFDHFDNWQTFWNYGQCAFASVQKRVWDDSGDEEDFSGLEDGKSDDDYISESEHSESDGSESSEAKTGGEDSDETGADNARNGPPPKWQRKRNATVPNLHWVRPNLAPPPDMPTENPQIQFYPLLSSSSLKVQYL